MWPRLSAIVIACGVATGVSADPPDDSNKPRPAAMELLRAARNKGKAPDNRADEVVRVPAAGDGPGPAAKAMQAAARRAKRDQARKQQHEGLTRRLQGRDVPPALRAELRTHARRISRLLRVRELASVSDRRSLVRIDDLITRENARHERRVVMLIDLAKAARPDDDGELDDEVEE